MEGWGEAEGVCVRREEGSTWWREIARIREGAGSTRGGWFGDCIVKKVGDGLDTLFSTDPCLGGVPLRERFRRLFDLSVYQSSTVADMSSLGLSILIGGSDRLILIEVPHKVSILAWRLLRDKLLTKENLVARGIITPDAQYCVSGCGGVESAQHLFLSCQVFSSLWSVVRFWIGFLSADAHHLSDHLVQFTFSSSGSRARRSFLQLIWIACVWVVWTERNQRLFRNSECPLPQLLNKVKLFSYMWLKTTNCNLVSNYHN
ncbi:hypothetical protein TSUD_143120 [Trifolium subterraneum]|uniref:Reverse transcriptase zinc-binding domain-containing protein n=1 Tax=Trifolium subterraneum TaxID=3900 RepID=A0A2Z6PAZ9_TRISU|nr:hypothetical protein TSUD_143120 [Trifolium subterraneum]